MRTELSERTLEYHVTKELEEILTDFNEIENVIPIFPTPRQENRLGYDVEIPLKGRVYLIQYKVSRLLLTRAAKYRINPNSNTPEREVYNEPYYSFKLRDTINSPQHTLLIDLGINGIYGDPRPVEVYYVAPFFLKTQEIQGDGPYPFSSNSIFIDINDTFPTDQFEQNEISYQSIDNWHQHSEPKKGKNLAFNGHSITTKIAADIKDRSYNIDLELLQMIRNYLNQSLIRIGIFTGIEELNDINSILQDLQILTYGYHNSVMVLVKKNID